MLENIFSKFDLKEEHIKIYLSLLEGGLLSAGDLAKRLAIPRSTLYGFLYDLVHKGLVRQSEKAKVIIWQAESPEKINDLLDEKINSFEQAKQNLANVLTDLKDKRKTDFISPHFQYFEGSEGLRQVMKDVLLYRDISVESFWPIKDMLDVLGNDFFIYFNHKRISQNIYIRAIWPESKKVDIKQNIFLGVGKEFKREIRLSPPDIECSMGYFTYKNKAAFISSKKESFGFIVESLELKELLLTQFELLWKASKKIEVDIKYTKEFLKNL